MDGVECCKMEVDRMNVGDMYVGGGGRNMYVFFLVLLFLVSNTDTGEGPEKEDCGWEMLTFLFYSFTETSWIRAGGRQEKCHATAKGKDRAFDWPMDQGLKCKSAKFFSCLTCDKDIM